MPLRIKKINPTGKTFLSLEGTILIINESNKYSKSEVQVPVELISIYEDKKCKAKDILISLISLPFIAFSGAMLYGFLIGFLNNINTNIKGYIFVAGNFVLFLIGISFFLFFMIKFFLKQKTISLVISPNNYAIEFWKEPKQIHQINEFLNHIEHRKTFVEESMVQPLQKSVGFGEQRSRIPQLIGSMVLFSMPATITENIKLLPLALIPLAFFIYNKIFELTKTPKLYRQALKHYFKEQWDEAISLLETLKGNFPEYLPSYTLLTSIYTRTNRFDEAMEIVSELPEQYSDFANAITSDIWRHKRINKRRTEQIPEINNI